MIPPVFIATPPAVFAPVTTENRATTSWIADTPASSTGTEPETNSSTLQYPYASIQAGIGMPNKLNGEFDLLGLATIENSLDLDHGFNGEFAIGYKFPDFRADLSIGYSNFSSSNQTITVPGFGSASVSGVGSANLFTLMANGYYDFKIKKKNGELSRWSPYIGGGIGWGSLSTPSCAIPSCTLFQGGSADVFTYQGKAGLSYRATNNGFAFLEAGYLGTGATTVDNVNYDPFGTWRINIGWRQKL